MVFSSNVFLFLFLPTFLLVYFLARPAWRNAVIVAGSYLFYAWWRPDFLLLFVGITYWNYWFGLRIYARLQEGKKQQAFRLLWLGIAGNLSTLGYFKYANFGADVLAILLAPLGIDTFTLEHIFLPLGISFYIFHALSYIVDIYRKDAEPTKNFISFAAFVALFPHLVAGPILRYSLLAPQLRQRTHSLELFSLGVCRFMQGFIMKVLIADSLAPLSALFLAEPNLTASEAWVGLLAAVLQLYFDFAGYSHMAIGLALMMGFRFAENFNQPMVAQSITEFWARWHITLAHFLRDYVFLPLVRKRMAGAAAAMIITMLLSGLWHGASFAFILWGLFFGVAMVIERKLDIATKIKTPYRFLRNVRAMCLLLLCMPLFFTNNLAHSIDIYAALFGANGMGSLERYQFGASQMAFGFLAAALLWIICAGVINVRYYQQAKGTPYFMQQVGLWQSLLLWFGFFVALTHLAANAFSPFLYFQF